MDAGVNGISGTITGPGLNRALTTAELTAGTQSIGPLSAGNYTYTLRLNGEAGTTQATRMFSVTVSTTPPDPDPVTIDSFTRVPSTIESGESSLLSWTTSNADRGHAGWGHGELSDGIDECLADRDDRLRSASYRRGRAGDAERDGDGDRSTPAADRSRGCELFAKRRTIDPGDSVTISWVTRNGDTRELSTASPDRMALRITYQNQAASGSRTFTPTVTTTYQIQRLECG